MFDFVCSTRYNLSSAFLSTAANILDATLKRVDFMIHLCLNFGKGDLISCNSSLVNYDEAISLCGKTRTGMAFFKWMLHRRKH